MRERERERGRIDNNEENYLCTDILRSGGEEEPRWQFNRLLIGPGFGPRIGLSFD